MQISAARQLVEFTAAQIALSIGAPMLHYGPGPHPDGSPQSVHAGGSNPATKPPAADTGQMGFDFETQTEPQLSPEEARRQARAAEWQRKHANDALAQAAHDKLVAAWKSKKDTHVGGEWKKAKYDAPYTWTDADGIAHALQTHDWESYKTHGMLRNPAGTSREVGAELISKHPDGEREARTMLFRRAARGESHEADQRMTDARQELQERIIRKFGIADPGVT